MSNATMKCSKDGYSYSIKFNKLTEGELMALVRALRFYDSPVGNDVLAYVKNAAYELDNAVYNRIGEYIEVVK